MITDYGANLLLDYLLGNRTLDDIPYLYLGLSQNPAGKSGFINEPHESTGYRRLKVRNNYENFPRAINGVKSNAVKLNFDHISGVHTFRSFFISLVPTGNAKTIFSADIPPKVVVDSMPYLFPGSVTITFN